MCVCVRACARVYLQRLHDDEDVVHAHGQHQEGDDLDDDERERHAGVAEDAQGAGHRAQHDQDARDAQRHLGVHLERVERRGGSRYDWGVRYADR